MTWSPAVWSTLFLLANVVALLILFHFAKGGPASAEPEILAPPPGTLSKITAAEVLSWEFEYARATASEAMQDRHTMVNFYLLLVGVVGSGVLAILEKLTQFKIAAAFLLWTVSVLGWFYLLTLVRLRQAWYDSALTLLRIKEFCIQHVSDMDPAILRQAFRWNMNTLPRPEKKWNVFFYSALLIGFLDSVAFVSGSYILAYEQGAPIEVFNLFLGMALFLFHIGLYSRFLNRGERS